MGTARNKWMKVKSSIEFLQITILWQLFFETKSQKVAEIKSNSFAYFLRQSNQYLNTYFNILIKFY